MVACPEVPPSADDAPHVMADTPRAARSLVIRRSIMLRSGSYPPPAGAGLPCFRASGLRPDAEGQRVSGRASALLSTAKRACEGPAQRCRLGRTRSVSSGARRTPASASRSRSAGSRPVRGRTSSDPAARCTLWPSRVSLSLRRRSPLVQRECSSGPLLCAGIKRKTAERLRNSATSGGDRKRPDAVVRPGRGADPSPRAQRVSLTKAHGRHSG
jgi:hypothetical protein